MNYISQVKNLKGKTILLRSDVNSDIIGGKVAFSERIKSTAETVKYLKKKGAKVVVIAHQSRPGKKDFISLAQHARLIEKITKIKFVKDLYGLTAQKAIKNLKNGEAILLENVRFDKSEFKKGKSKYVVTLSKLCDIYVNDAFSVSHREQASIVEFPKMMKSYGGPILEKEVRALQKIKLGKCLYVLGGAKPADNMILIGKNKIISTGLFGPMCLIAEGKKLGGEEKSLEKSIHNYKDILNKIKKKLKVYGRSVVLPVDFAVLSNGKRKEISLDKFPNDFETFDIGKKTQEVYIKEIKKAKAVYVKGPAGYYTDKRFIAGTRALLYAISKSKAFSLLGGGDLNEAIKMSGLSAKDFNHVSLSGGALLDYIAGKKLPGLAGLGFYRK